MRGPRRRFAIFRLLGAISKKCKTPPRPSHRSALYVYFFSLQKALSCSGYLNSTVAAPANLKISSWALSCSGYSFLNSSCYNSSTRLQRLPHLKISSCYNSSTRLQGLPRVNATKGFGHFENIANLQDHQCLDFHAFDVKIVCGSTTTFFLKNPNP